MRPVRTLVLALCLAASSMVVPREAEAQLSRAGGAAIGVVAGTLTGGYVTLAIVVARSRAGYYVSSVSELLGWQAAPVIIGAATGGVVGYIDHKRVFRGTAFAVGGGVAGYALGRLVGGLVWDPPEGSWAGGAIGAGVGVVAGGLIGAFVGDFSDDSRSAPAAGIFPISVRIPL